jgi:glutathione-regulated potassium-efflux system ancillary protein KefG
MPNQRILILFAHPALEKSRVNRVLVRYVQDLPGITFHDLYEAYPGLDIDISFEQKLLAEHDIIVFQHPLFWYSTPAILKEWQDLVLEHGWAYGKEGDALRGKMMFNAISAGGGEAAYHRKGLNRFTVRELLVPIEQTARLCGIDYLPPFVVHGTHGMTTDAIHNHALDYKRLLEAFRDGRVDIEASRQHPRLNSHLDAILTE